MAPEILLRRPFGLPVDVYAYAVLLNEMLMCRRPYEGNTPEVYLCIYIYIYTYIEIDIKNLMWVDAFMYFYTCTVDYVDI